ncbi:MAG: hypothetical protein KDB88_01120, partial [Flavobacteriales bacterium]|nr:hypothetical protein [Flavobacteriales bacterium]
VITLSFAVPSVGTTYDMEFVPAEESPAAVIADISDLQAQGKKVVLSIGGANASVHLNSDAERDQFVTSMMALIVTYGFDGIDIDLEGTSVSISGGSIQAPTDLPMQRMIQAIGMIMDLYRAQFGTKLFLTMAPETAYVQGGQSAWGGIWGAYLPLIHALRDSIDILQVQLYNSGSMYGVDGGIYTQGTADFIVSQTEAVIQGFNTGGGFFMGLDPEQVAVALPACASAAGGGFTDSLTVRMAVEYLLGQGPQPGSYQLQQAGGYPTLRGMMTWSVNWDAAAACDGAWSFADVYERVFDPLATAIALREKQTLSVFPNPASDRVFIAVDGSSGPLDIRWTDAMGRIVRSEGHQGEGVVELSVRDLSTGTYVIELAAVDGAIRRAVVVVE